MRVQVIVALCAVITVITVITGCTEGEPPAARGEAEAEAEATARAAAQALGRRLKTRLLRAMQDGPAEAATVCANEAQELTRVVAQEHGARVGRTSVKLRQPDNDGPDWATAWLRDQGTRAEGARPRTFIEGSTARFIAPIAVEGPCLNCHGSTESISPEVQAVLNARYPTDRATGYALGDLRGALWAEVDLQPR